MFTPRTLATVLTLGALIGLVYAGFAVWDEPGYERFSRDSYSGSMIGQRALVEVLQELDVPIARSTDAPPDLFKGERRVLLLQPSIWAVELEKRYLDTLQEWVESGGELVLASDRFFAATSEFQPTYLQDADTLDEDVLDGNNETLADLLDHYALLPKLGLDDLTLGIEEQDVTSRRSTAYQYGELAYSVDMFVRLPRRLYPARTRGSLQLEDGAVTDLYLPEDDLHYLEGDVLDDALGTITVEGDEEESRIVAATFSCGEGEVTVVSEPCILTNLGFTDGDNAVAAYHLAMGDGDRPVLVDEYYHGGLQTGSALVLMGLYPYNLILSMCLLAVGVWAWAHGLRFGPPADSPPPSRRSIVEYIEAMGRLFYRGRKHQFILSACVDGLVDEIRRELLLPPGTSHDVIMNRLTHHDEARAGRLRAAMEQTHARLAEDSRMSNEELLEHQERLLACRMTKRHNPPKSAVSTLLSFTPQR
jgi:hypothetical protein